MFSATDFLKAFQKALQK